MKKKILYTILGLIALVAIWYFFIKQYDYQITFKAKHPKGLVYHTIQEWNYANSTEDSLLTTYKAIPYHRVEQGFKPSPDSLVLVNWELEKINDTTTEVRGYFKSDESSIGERAKLVFTKTDFVNQSLSFAKELRKFLQLKNDTYRISGIDTVQVDPKKYLYVEKKTTTKSKANTMIAENGFVMAYITRNNLKLTDFPFVDIQSWNKETDSISLKFCFPIAEAHVSTNSNIKFEEKPEFEALRITFNGNYSKSHFAWYAYDDYFVKHGVTQEILPTELFFNDPSQGGNQLEWRADVLLPLNKLKL